MSETTYPEAKIVSSTEASAGMRTKLWWLALLCAVISIGLFWIAKQNSGELIAIEFDDSRGLKLEDRLKYRGVDIGAVEKIELNAERGVTVHVRMTRESRTLAADGARFWIVRPSVSFDAIHGLDTILGAKYLALDPAPQGSKLATRFRGLESPPIISPREGSLEIVLDAANRGGLESNAPVLYRGFRIGQVVQVGFASDAKSVQARCAIDPEYRDLVRRNSKFWNRSGWRLDVGLAGIKLDADTLTQMITGGIEMATPTEADRAVSTGHRFRLFDKPEAEWTNWQPALAHGEAWNRVASGMPQPIRIAKRWQERSFGFRKNQQLSSWCLPLSDGTLLCFSEQIVAPKTALADSLTFELAGLSLGASQLVDQSKPSEQLGQTPWVSRVAIREPLPAEVVRWSSGLVAGNLPDKICDVFVAHPDATSGVAIAAARLSLSDGNWLVDDLVALGSDYHGLPVVSAETSQVVGLLSVNKAKSSIVAIKR